MAIVRNNPLLKGVSGMLGNTVVFKLLRGKTIVANRPRKPSRQSEAQRDNRLKFKNAANFAKLAMQDPVKKEYYWRKARTLKLPNAYTAAITDYMRKPDVNTITVEEQKQARRVVVHAFKKAFALKRISVQCLDIHRQVIDLYEAQPDGEGKWGFGMPSSPRVELLRLIILDDTGQTSRYERPFP